MKICVEDLAFTQLGSFNRLRFLHLHDHLTLVKNGVGPVDDLCSRRDVAFIRRADSQSGTRFDPDIVATRRQFRAHSLVSGQRDIRDF